MARGGKFCIELNFIRDGKGRSRRAKIKSFWEFIDAQKDLVPLNTSLQGDAGSNMNLSSPSVCRKTNNLKSGEYNRSMNDISSQEIVEKESASNNPDVCTKADDLSSNERIWYNELRSLKQFGLDRVALVASKACKRCLREERLNADKEPEYADSVRQSYDELAADLKAFKKRTKGQKPKCAYKDPEKYRHLIQ